MFFLLGTVCLACAPRGGAPRDAEAPVAKASAPSAKAPEATKARDAARSDRRRDPAAVWLAARDDGASGERPTVALMLRAAADGVARKTHALERLADRTRGASQATVYKALQALEKERAIFSDLSERVDTVDEREWESFKREAWRALDAVADPDDDVDADAHAEAPPAAAQREKPTGSTTAAKH
ncbi:hypothetical protein [Pendulispora albinea]|uniref:Uncharacterized protein n=1 Tax=Pendulispora albinea TaxID=2741071 RepID=A0ABZ2LWU0_9BACT